jgi:YgiT-type zinc finger domain-containing protein
VRKSIKQDFWIRGKLGVIDNVSAGVCPRCGFKVVNTETGKRLAAILQNLREWSNAPVVSVSVVELRP